MSIDYYHPIADDSELRRRDCNEYAGPKDKIIINGPEGVIFTAEALPEEISTLLVFSIIIPEKVFVTFEDNLFLVKDKNSDRIISEKISVVYPKAIYPFYYYGTRFPKEGKNIFDKLIGGIVHSVSHIGGVYSPSLEKFGKPYAIYLELYEFKPKHFTLTIPKIRINGIDFQLTEISFQLKRGIFIYPLNC